MSRSKNRNNRAPSKRGGRSTRSRNGRSNNTLGGVLLTRVNNKPIMRRTIRYECQGLTTTSWTCNSENIRDAIGHVISGNTNYYPIFESIRLRRVGVSAQLSGTTGTGVVDFSWKGDHSPQIFDTTYVAIGVPTTRNYYPPSGTSSSWWYDLNATADDLFIVQAGAYNSGVLVIFVDVDFEFILNDGFVTASTITAPGFTGLAARRFNTASITAVGLQGVN